MPDLTMTRPVTEPSAPVARRLQRPSWKDPRLLVGVLLVLGSIVAGALVVSAADETVPVYVAARALGPGERLAVSDLDVAQVRLGERQRRYVSAAAALPAGRVLVRPVPAGDLVPLSALGEATQVDVRPLSVPVPADGSERIDAGVLVDVWVADRDTERGSTAYAAPRQVATAVPVAGRSTRQGALGSSTSTSLQLMLSRSLLPQVIQAVDNGARVTVVPVPATLGGDAS